MVNDQDWFTEGNKGKIQINSLAIYRKLSSEVVKQLDNNLSVSEIIGWIRRQTIEAFESKYLKIPKDGALNNSVGRWNELIATSLLSEIALDLNQKNRNSIVIFSLPNSQVQKEGAGEVSSKFLSLFSSEEFTKGKSLSKLAPFKDQIFLPSPDYIVTVFENKETSMSIRSLLEKQAREPDSILLYKNLKGKIRIEEVKAAVSLKTSNRPDRRYQPLFEAAMIKAMNYALQQNWKYYMVASELTLADKTIFSTAIAPHSIALEQKSLLVDGAYLYSRKEDLIPLIEAAIQ